MFFFFTFLQIFTIFLQLLIFYLANFLYLIIVTFRINFLVAKLCYAFEEKLFLSASFHNFMKKESDSWVGKITLFIFI